ncbi:putative ABC transport system ATP-binding protein [Micrococcales bacterium KH10]|nr:putative ABC transport system ATP-binding protein [Micrococcales bacterium KH10]
MNPTTFRPVNTKVHGTPVLRINAASRYYRDGDAEIRALDEINLTVHAGEFVAVMGPSGSGKSTLLSLAGALDTPTRGEVVLAGANISALNATGRAAVRRRHAGFVFQDYNLVPALTAAENIALPLELDGMSVRQARRAARAALIDVDAVELTDRFPDQMSGGQRQRVAIARALVGERSLLLADEPTGALDTNTGETIMRVLRARIDAGAAGILVTHDARHAAWADRTVFLRDGRVTDETGTAAAPDDLLLRGTAR